MTDHNDTAGATATRRSFLDVVDAMEDENDSLKARLAEAQEASVELQRHRDHWRGYAYGKRDRPLDFLDGNMVDADRPPTMVERAHAAEARVAVLEKALSATLDQYVSMALSGDCGFWDPEEEHHVIAARGALAAEQKEAGR